MPTHHSSDITMFQHPFFRDPSKVNFFLQQFWISSEMPVVLHIELMWKDLIFFPLPFLIPHFLSFHDQVLQAKMTLQIISTGYIWPKFFLFPTQVKNSLFCNAIPSTNYIFLDALLHWFVAGVRIAQAGEKTIQEGEKTIQAGVKLTILYVIIMFNYFSVILIICIGRKHTSYLPITNANFHIVYSFRGQDNDKRPSCFLLV